MQIRKRVLPAAIALAAGLYQGAASADVAEVVNAEGDLMTFEYEGDMLRMNMPSGDAKETQYSVVRDGRMYVVTQQDNGKAMVIDLSSAISMFGKMAENSTPDSISTEVISLEATGREETLGGMRGEVYELRHVDHEGAEKTSELVLSDDPRALGFRDAMQAMAMTVTNMLDEETFKDERKVGEDMQARLEDMNMGVLRYGQDMKIRSIEDTTVDAQRFELPAEPTDIGTAFSEALGGGQGGSGGDSGGVLGSIFGGGDQQEAPAEGEQQEQNKGSTAEEVGKAVGEAFGKLFGD